MKLEPKLIKKILEFGEDNLPDRSKTTSTENIVINGYSREQIIFHLNLLWKNGYVDCLDVSDLNQEDYLYNNLTMNGYQYLNLLRSKAWKTAEKLVKDLGVIFVEGAIKAVIDKYSQTLLT